MSHRSLAGVTALVVAAALVGWFWPSAEGEVSSPPRDRAAVDARAADAAADPASLRPEVAERTAADPLPDEEAAVVVITGRAVDAFEQPLAGVLVEGLGERSPRTATRDDGRFELRAARGTGGRLTLVLRGADLALTAFAVDVPAREPGVDVGDLQLGNGGALAGNVIDGLGRPLPGAAVRALPGANNPFPAGAAALLAAATTDPRGEYRLAGLPPGSWRVRATAERSIAATSPSLRIADGAETRVDTLQLAPGVDLRGSVVGSDGEPIADAAVRAGNERAASGPDGRFVVEHLPAGACAVEVSAPGWLGWQQRDVDPSRELRIVLPKGLVVTGAVVDARSGEAVEPFAVHARRLQPLRAVQQGPPAWQLQRRAGLLRQAAGQTQDAAARARDQAVADEYDARLAKLQNQAPPALRVPDDLGAPSLHEGGRFTVDKLDEGLWVVEVLAPAHEFACTEPFELRRDAPPPVFRIALHPASTLTGSVRDGDGVAVPGATVELVRTRDGAASAASGGPSRFGWLVGAPSPPGDRLCAVATGRDGRFAMPHVPGGNYQLAVQHAAYCTSASPPFAIGADHDLDVILQRRPSLAGRVLGVPAGRGADVHVTVLGGGSNLRATPIDDQGHYRFAALEPGEYLVRATLGDLAAAHADLVHATLAANAEPPPRDVVLAAGENRTFDVTLPLLALGTVRGTVLLNGSPAAGCRITLAVPGTARPLTAVADAAGGFTMRDVPAGEAELRISVRSGGSQELYRAPLAVVADRVTTVDPVLFAGTLAGRVTANDGTPSAQWNGDLLVLPGCTEVPADLTAYRRDHRVHAVAVRAGGFRSDALTPGRALVVVRLRNREPATAVVDVTPGSVAEVELPAGRARQ